MLFIHGVDNLAISGCSDPRCGGVVECRCGSVLRTIRTCEAGQPVSKMSMNRSSLFSEHDIVFIHSNGLIYISLFATLLSLSVNTNNKHSEQQTRRIRNTVNNRHIG